MMLIVARNPCFFLLLGCLLLGQSPLAQADIQKVQQCMRANLPTSVQLKQLRLQYFDRLGQASSYELDIYARHGKQDFEASVMITQPRKLAGSAYLFQSDADSYQIYMYAPTLGKVRRVSGDGLVQSSFLGTDISWEDLQIIYNSFAAGTTTLMGEGQVQGRTVYKVVMRPDAQSTSAYSQIQLEIDKQSCVPLQIKLMQQGDVLRKVFTTEASSLTRTSDRYWYAAKGRLEDTLEGTHTRLEVLQQIEADEKLSIRLFNSRTFYQSR